MNRAKPSVDPPTPAATSTATPSGTPATLPTARSGQSWRVQTQGRKLAVMWVIIAILGILLISVTTGVPRLLIPVLLLLTYAWYGYKYVARAGELVALRYARVGQLADSLYFLGFLWTLGALIDSFVIQQISIAESVFRAFGYALVTTATGMFLRLLLLQFGYSAEDQGRLGELTVEEEISRFTNEVGRAVESIRGFHTRTNSALTGWIDSLNRSTAALKTAVDDVRAQTVDLTGALVEIRQENAKHLDEIVETALGQFIHKVAPSLEALSNANKQFVTEVKSSTTKVQAVVHAGVKNIDLAVDSGLTQIQSELSSGANAISTGFVGSTRTIQTATTQFTDTLLKEMRKLESNVTGVSKQIAAIRVPADIVEKTVAHQIATVTASLLGSTRSLETAIKQLERSVLSVGEHVSTMRRRPWWQFWG